MKKIIAIMLVIVTLFSTVTVTVSAAEAQTANQTAGNETTGSITNDDMTIKGTNSFGNMLSEEIQQNTDETPDNGSRISEVEMNGTTASVTYDALMDCTILIGIFDENTDQLVASGKSEVSKEETSVQITIEATQLPEYYVVKGYMLGDNNSPIAPEFSTTLYTKSIQEIKNKTVADFDESQVLNLDESDETNFAVYKEGTVVLEYEEGYNTPEIIDSTNGTYTFSNATEELLSLQSGDALSYQYSEKDVLVLVVDTITADGTTVTIKEKDSDLKDVFELVKIEATSGSS